MSVSVFDHPFLSGLLGDEEVGAWFSAGADLAAMLSFEEALAVAEAEEGLIPKQAAGAVAAAIARFRPDWEHLRAGTARDGVVAPQLVKALSAAVGEPYGRYVHFGATSQDAIDTSLALRLKSVTRVLGDRLDELADRLEALAARDGATGSMAHTRMQAAVPVTAARKIASWREPLLRDRARLASIADELSAVQFGGAAGTLDRLGEAGPAVVRRIAARLGLSAPRRPRHSERDVIVELASWLSLVTGSLGKAGQDIALMAQSEIGEVKLKNGGGSSAMPGKVNPVGAEILVTLARFNATLVSGMHQALVHENERSGAAWTLEWMLLPQMAVATAAALRTAGTLIANIRFVERSN